MAGRPLACVVGQPTQGTRTAIASAQREPGFSDRDEDHSGEEHETPVRRIERAGAEGHLQPGHVDDGKHDGDARRYAEDLDRVLDEALILDVRRNDEWVTEHVPGALHIPHTELRGRIDEVREQAAGRPVRVMCASGVRSAIAHRVVAQAGMDSASLSGGILTLRAALGARASDMLETESVLQPC